MFNWKGSTSRVETELLYHRVPYLTANLGHVAPWDRL